MRILYHIFVGYIPLKSPKPSKSNPINSRQNCLILDDLWVPHFGNHIISYSGWVNPNEESP